MAVSRTQPILKVRYSEWPPWSLDISDGKNGSILSGLFKDVLEALSTSLNYKFVLTSQVDHNYGSLQPDGSYSGMIGSVTRNESDMSSPLVANYARSLVVDFTNCLEFSRLGIITGIESSDRNMFLYVKVFSWQVWLSLLITIIVAAFVSLFIYDVTVNGWKHPQGRLISRYLWVFWSYLLGHDCGTTEHVALKHIWFLNSFRILLAAYLLGPVINSNFSFQGQITSTFAISKLRSIVSDLDELTEKKHIIPVTTRGSAVQICFKGSKDYAHIWDRMVNNSIYFNAENLQKTLENVERGTHVFIVDYIYALSMVSDFLKKTGRCTVQVEEFLFCQNFVTLALRKSFDPKMKKDINTRFTYIVQAKLADRWLNRVYRNYTHCSKQPSDGIKPLSVTDISGGFVLWGIGLTTSILLFSAEVATLKAVKKREQKKFVDPFVDDLTLKA